MATRCGADVIGDLAEGQRLADRDPLRIAGPFVRTHPAGVVTVITPASRMFRSFGFDSAVVVLLSATDYVVSRASKISRDVVESSAIYRQHVNGKVLLASPEIMGHPDATDLTATLRAVQTGHKTP